MTDKLLPNINSPADLRDLSLDELARLAAEMRQEIVGAVANTGGHLGSNLGVVELTIALHYVFNAPDDKIIWDVSHQSYPHKLLTGRRDRIQTLRTYGGLAGYCRRSESEYDPFGAGHASTSISAALGFAVARDLQNKDYEVIAVIGDGAMTGGLAFEGLNNAGSLRKDMIVVLNDNTWSISRNVGAISKYLTSMLADEKFNKLRAEVWELTGRFKRRDKIRATIQRLEKSIKGLLVPGMLFEKLGFRYFGPIDGHDLPQLVRTLKDMSNIRGPRLLHVATVKGKGFGPAEDDALRSHAVGKFDKTTGVARPSGGELPAYTTVFGRVMLELAAKNDKVIAITAAMAPGTGLDEFADKYPNRFFDVGIAEGHAATFAAAAHAEGLKPYLTIYSTFMQRAYDMVIHDMAIQRLPVVICMDRGGLVGNDGPTHHGVFDLAFLSTVPNVTVAAPKDGNELRSMLHHTVDNQLTEVTAIRYPRDTIPAPMTVGVEPIAWGTWEWLTPPTEFIVLAVGTMVHQALLAAHELEEKGLEVSIVNARFVKPMDQRFLEHLLKHARLVMTVEEGALRGGFGQAVADHLLSHGFDGRFQALGLTDEFVTHGDRAELLRDVGLDAEGLAVAFAEFADTHHALLSHKHRARGGFLQRLGLRRNGHKDSHPTASTGTDAG